MKHLLFCTFFLSSFTITLSAQTDCKRNIFDAKYFLQGDAYTSPDFEKAFSLLQPCAESGEPVALNLMGIMYLNGDGVKKDESKAFEFMQKAAQKGFHPAEYNLGRMYKLGQGCEMNFDTALEHFTSAASKGNEMAAYSIGYMYFKGLGVEQNYETALEWFRTTEYPMARHWLAYCMYFGYGIPTNVDEATSLLENNDIINSKKLLKYIKENKRSKILAQNNDELYGGKKDSTDIFKEAVPTKVIPVKAVKLNPKKLNGSWSGKMLEFDWSGKTIERVFPVNLTFKIDGDDIQYVWTIEEQKSEGNVSWSNNILTYQDLNFNLNLPFSGNPHSNSMEWHILSSEFELKKIKTETYLLGNIETFSEEWKEPGPPRSLVLQLNRKTSDVEENSDEVFFVAYPNPFTDQLFIEYKLEKESTVSIEIFNFNTGRNRKVIEVNKTKSAGTYTHAVQDYNLQPGIYVVKVKVNHEEEALLVIKK